MMIRIAICDDDFGFLADFSQLITQSFENAGQQVRVCLFGNGKDLIEKIEKDKQIYDVIFLDVSMPAIHGFQVAQRLRELNAVFILVFTTYMEHQSREGYLYGAFRYVFKNNLDSEINEAVSAIVKRLGNETSNEEEIMFKSRNSGILENLMIKKKDIIYLKMEKTRRVVLKTVYSDYELLVKPLSKYAELLESENFVFIMRNYLLNLNHVESVDGDSFVLTGGQEVPLGIKREARKASLEKYLRFLEERI